MKKTLDEQLEELVEDPEKRGQLKELFKEDLLRLMADELDTKALMTQHDKRLNGLVLRKELWKKLNNWL